MHLIDPVTIPIGGKGFNATRLGSKEVPCRQYSATLGAPVPAQRPVEHKGAAWAARGAWSAMRALVGSDPAPPAVVAERAAQCAACEHGGKSKHWTRWIIGTCALCGCCTSLKVKLAGEWCPDSPARWTPCTLDGRPLPVPAPGEKI